MAFLGAVIPGLSFGVPYVLWALLVLPAIYWLLRVTPPAPKRVTFPPLRLLLGLVAPEETPARTPLWLLLLRLAMAAIAIIALAEPVIDTTPATQGNGPLILVVDNDWAAAQQWQLRVNAMHGVLSTAASAKRPVTIIRTAEPSPMSPPWMDANRALSTADEMVPEPWLPDRKKALAALAGLKAPSNAQILWLSDGIDDAGARAFADGLTKLGVMTVYVDDALKAPLAIKPPDNGANGFGVTVIRAPADAGRDGRVAALDSRGRILETAPFRFAPRATEAKAMITLPLELRNDTVRIAVQGAESAGSVQLVDARYRRRPVGLVSGSGTDEQEQPLLSDTRYIDQALQPFAEIRKGTIDQVLDSGIAVLALADIGQLTTAEHDRVSKFVADGGMLLRFAGPRTAASNGDDDLLPVKLRAGERLMGGALAWASPQHLAAFGQDSPFFGLAVPPEVTVSRQVLAEPSIELGDHTWARLTDGTPLVTAIPRGKGWIVLFHVSASPGWSSLPLSGLYVEMLRRTVAMSGGVRAGPTQQGGTLPPYQTLDAYGHLVHPFPEALAMKAADFETMMPDALHPPGLYGNEGAVVALNAVTAKTALHRLDAGRSLFAYASGGSTRVLKWPLLELVLLMVLFDALISLVLRGYLTLSNLRGMTRRATAAGAAAFFLLAAGHASRADEATNMAAALDTRLAYVITGVPDVDEMSKAGLFGLGLQLRARTSYQPASPIGVDVERDDLSFYPLLYWPMAPQQKDLSPQAVAKIDAYMREGGTILFDTRDQPLSGLGGTAVSPGEQTLRRLLSKLDIPPLQPLPPDHVLTKTFYLLKEFPGRWIGGQVWVEAIPPRKPGEDAPARGGDGVSPIIIGGNDWAAAWALDNEAQPIAAVVPGGEEQREMAVRFGINVAIYAMTGNYKTDAVHAGALLERLGNGKQ